MMKKGRSIIILLVVFAALIGGYIYLTKHPKKTTTSSESSNSISILSADSKKISQVSLSSKNGVINLEKKGDNWQLKDSPSIKLVQSSVTTIVTDFTALTAEKVIDPNPTKLDNYGLATPSVTGTATLEDGSKKVIFLGDRAPSGADFYLMVKDDPKVYLVAGSIGNNLTTTAADLRDKTLTTVDTSNLNYFKVVNDKGRTVEVKTNTNQTDDQKQLNLGTYILTQPYSRQFGIDGTKFTTFVQGLPAFEIADIVEDNAKDLSKYGLDKPKYDVTMTDTNKNTLHVQVGNNKDSDYTYFKLSDSNTVYTMSSSNIDGLNVDPLKIISSFVYIVNIDDVDKIVVDSPGKENVMTLSRTTKKATKSGEEDTTTTTYNVDGKNVEEEKFKNFYQELIGLTVDAETDKQVPEKPEITTTFTFNKGTTKTEKIEYCPYDDNFYGAYVDGKCEFLIAKDKVQKMITDLQALGTTTTTKSK